MKISEQLMYNTTKITSYYDNGTIAYGTGFFMVFNKDDIKHQPVIVTNKHVVKDAASLSFNICLSNENNEPIDSKKMNIKLEGINIIYHPDDDVDLCAIPIAQIDRFIYENNINLFKLMFGTDLIISSEEIQNCSAIEDVIMIGYPIGIEDYVNNKPVIRKGITSTHMRFDYNVRKNF